MPDPTGSFMTAFVEIQANVGDLKRQMEEVKKTVKDAATNSEETFKKHTKGIESSFDSMVTNIKRLLLGAGIIGTFTYIAKEAMVGQDAVNILGRSLKVTGDYSIAAMSKFSEFANKVQEVTVHSNDETLMLMRLQHSLGVSSDKMEMATIWAIGLSDALDLDTESTSRYVALALEGEFRMLSRWIPALKTASTEHEKLAILNKFATNAFELSGQRAMTASGAYKQMKNTLQDVVQSLGYGLLPVITETSKQIKTWAENNVGKIAYWADMFWAYIGFVKDAIIDLVTFMKKDFTSGASISYRILLELAVGFADSFVLICGNAATRAYHAFVSEFGDNLGKWLISIAQPKSTIGKAIGLTPAGMLGRTGLMEAGVNLVKGASEKQEIAAIGPQIEDVARDAAGRIKKIYDESGVDLSASSDKLTEKLVGIKENQVKRLIEADANGVSEAKKLLESLGDVDMFPERSKEEKMAEVNMKNKLVDMQAELDVETKIGLSWNKTREQIDLQTLALKAAGENANLYAEYMKKVDFVTQQQKISKTWNEFGRNIQSSLESAFDGIMKKGDDFKTFMTNIAQAVADEWMKMNVIQPASQALSSGITSLMKGVIGTTTPTTTPTTTAGVGHQGGDVGSLPTRQVPSHVFAGAQKYHGLGPNEQAIIAEKGETISRGKSPNIILNLNLSAIDTQSGIAFLAKNQSVLTGLLNRAVRQNDRALRG